MKSLKISRFENLKINDMRSINDTLSYRLKIMYGRTGAIRHVSTDESSIEGYGIIMACPFG
jgi:hypothetical protein